MSGIFWLINTPNLHFYLSSSKSRANHFKDHGYKMCCLRLNLLEFVRFKLIMQCSVVHSKPQMMTGHYQLDLLLTSAGFNDKFILNKSIRMTSCQQWFHALIKPINKLIKGIRIKSHTPKVKNVHNSTHNLLLFSNQCFNQVMKVQKGLIRLVIGLSAWDWSNFGTSDLTFLVQGSLFPLCLFLRSFNLFEPFLVIQYQLPWALIEL